MPVKQHRFIFLNITGAGNIEKQYRRTAIDAHHVQREPGNILCRHPFGRLLNRCVEKTMLSPIVIEARGLRGQLHVLDQLRDDVGVPLPGYVVL